MATYFVRKGGSDAYSTAQAQVAATAWLTIDKAADEVVAGDTVVVGSGVFREQVVVDTAGTNGNQITFVADVDGALGSGDPGLVIISAYADETSAAIRASCVNPNEKDFITWRGFVMTGGTSGVVWAVGANGYEGCVWEDCVLLAGHDDADECVYLDFETTATPTNDGPTWRRCLFMGSALHFVWTGNESAEVDLKIVVESCVFGGAPAATYGAAGVYFDISGAGTYASGGVAVTNCTFFGKYFGVYVEDGASTTYPVAVENCLFLYCRYGVNKQTTNDSALTSDYNTFAACAAAYTSVDTGANDRDQTTDPGLLGGIGDYPLTRFWGWSPFRPWEPVRLQDDSYVHAVIGDADTAVAPAFDLYDEARPMYGTVDDRGAVEGRARAEQETTTVKTGANAIRFEGAGFHDMLIPVGTSLTTIDVEAYHDGTYAGTLPTLQALNIPGVADQSDVQTGGSGSWESLQVTFTATSDGIARIRLLSSDTSAAGECFFDDLAVS